MEKKIIINIVGVSNRIIKLYSPLLKKLLSEKQISIGYIYNRNIIKAKKLATYLGRGKAIDKLSSLKKTSNKSEIYIALVSLPPTKSFEYNIKLINQEINIFSETPISQKLWQADVIEKIVKKNNLFFGIGEDYCFAPDSLLLKKYCEKTYMPPIIQNSGKSSSFHAFSLFSTFYKHENLPKIKSYKSYLNKMESLKIKREIFKFEDNNIYILESFHPNKYVARNLGEIKLFYPNLTLTDKFYIFEGGGNIESTIYTENVQGEIIYKSKLLKDWECKKLHNIKSNFPLESYKINGLYYNFLSFLKLFSDPEYKNTIQYGIANAKYDLFLAKIQYLNTRLKINNLFLIKAIIYILKFFKKI